MLYFLWESYMVCVLLVYLGEPGCNTIGGGVKGGF